MTDEQFGVVFDSATVSRGQSWSPGVTLPAILAFLVVGVWAQPQLWWLAAVAVGVLGVLWLWRPFDFWVRGAAPLIEMSKTQVRVTARGRTRTEPLDGFELAEFCPGAGWVFSREETFASIQLMWKPESAPGAPGFPRAQAWVIDLPLRGRDRRSLLMQTARDFAAHGLACEFTDTRPRERIQAAI